MAFGIFSAGAAIRGEVRQAGLKTRLYDDAGRTEVRPYQFTTRDR